jgi:anhydro-N-acetylmuramic acid kinase
MMKNTYHVIGLMSGTSLDGLDIAYCRFDLKNKKWHYDIIKASTVPYSEKWKYMFLSAKTLTANEFALLHSTYGHFIGNSVKEFMDSHKIKIDLIASHGQTVFHQPENGVTSQIGSGAAIAAVTACTVVSDFRSMDVALYGQGAPLVPMGDEILFGEFDACLNIGGFTNISYQADGKRIAYDVCPANAVLNYLAQKAGKDYDDKGKMSAKGKISETLLAKLNSSEYYKAAKPKSMGYEWMDVHIMQHLYQCTLPVNDQLRTFTEHIAVQISDNIKACGAKTTLLTGGGAHNTFLVKRINALLDTELTIPSALMVDYKEALIFAFLGVLRLRNEVNCLKSATGASRDSCGGAVYYGNCCKGDS